MKKLREYITLNESEVGSLKPTNKDELKRLINQRIKEQGPNCDLNDIDVSKIDDMSRLFCDYKLNGEIGKWEEWEEKDRRYMLDCCRFNGKISEGMLVM